MMLTRSFQALVALSTLVAPAFAAFGLTTSGTKWTVDTNAGLVFTGESCLYQLTSSY